MKIPLEGTNYSIESNRDEWKLVNNRIIKSGPNAGKKDPKVVGHFPTIEMALRRFGEHLIREMDCEGFAECLGELRKVRAKVDELIEKALGDDNGRT